MDCELSDSSGTDDDLPPTHRNRFQIGGGAPQPSLHGDMETQIHNIEQEAYTSVLRAFKAQSDAITWEKESLITELRKELRVSDEEHRELLASVNSDDIIQRIRVWRRTNVIQPSMPSTTQVSHDPIASPSASGSRKKQKTSQSFASLSMVAPSTVLHPSMQPSTSALRRGPPPGSGNKKPKSSAINYLLVCPHHSFHLECVIYRISPEGIRWEDEETGLFRRGGRPGPGRGNKKSIARVGAVAAAGRGRGTIKGQSKKDFSLTKNGVAKKAMGDIEILHTDTLIKEVEKVFGASHPDPLVIEKAKKVLGEQEQALVKAIARLEDASDGESEIIGSDGNKMARNGRVVPSDHHDEDYDI
ncbi:protein EMSY [Salix suchowensis]|nr:protein EMSY [Salix suchowensis]